jgi:hypothetical protein
MSAMQRFYAALCRGLEVHDPDLARLVQLTQISLAQVRGFSVRELLQAVGIVQPNGEEAVEERSVFANTGWQVTLSGFEVLGISSGKLGGRNQAQLSRLGNSGRTMTDSQPQVSARE